MNHTRLPRYACLLLSLLVACSNLRASAAESSSKPQTPNIVLILSDDVGYGDVGCYGATLVKTPNIDRLAKEGRKFTDAHSPASTCTPTRRALLTGRYSWRQEPGSTIAPGDAPLSIPPSTTTLPSLLKQAGYTTGAVGKWHLGLGGENGPDWNGEIKPGPLELGFDYAFFMPATGDRVPCVYIEDHRIVGLDPNDPIKVSYRGKIGNDPTGADHPEMLKLKPTQGHDATIVNGVSRIGFMTGGQKARWVDEDMADTYTKKALGFIERSHQKPFFLYLATHNIHVPRVPNSRYDDKTTLGKRGDSIVELDDIVGKVYAKLAELNVLDNTLLIFTSDNGGIIDDGYHDFVKSEHKCNGDLRGFKGSLFEGGHRLPFIARWPGKIPAGSEGHELITHVDFVATCAALTGVKIPDGMALDSINVLPALLGQKIEHPLRETFVAHNGGTKGPLAIRHGDWKLVQTGGKNRDGQPLLFNLTKDPAEATNLAKEKPEKVAELQDLLTREMAKGK